MNALGSPNPESAAPRRGLEWPEASSRGPDVVLVVDDDPDVRHYLGMVLESEGYGVRLAGGGPEALDLIRAQSIDAVILDLNLPGMTGFEVLERCRLIGEAPPVIVVSGLNDVDTVVRSMKLGAADYITKPVDTDELRLLLAKVVASRRVDEPVERAVPVREPLPDPDSADDDADESGGAETPAAELEAAPEPEIDDADDGVENPVPPDSEWFTGGASMRRVWDLTGQIADTDVPVLITGESGVGKDIVARAIHQSSVRRDQLFVKINCAALPATLLESELFGHERGAFTGATRERAGKFELAHKGTIFLDEIAEMPVDLQAKLLQALQDETFYRVGGKRPVQVDVRVIAATNRDLAQAMRIGTFREDLYFRLNVVHVSVPPLRTRRPEVQPLIEFFLRKYAGRYRKGSIPAIPDRLQQRLLAYSWPGNVRQLENIIRRWVVLRDERYILEELQKDVDTQGQESTEEIAELPLETGEPLSLLDIGRRAAREAEKVAIIETLTRTGWNKRRAAAELQVSYKALLYKIKECGIVSPHAAAAAAAQARAPRRPAGT
jgi:two-component system response regulator AtoC